jgi:hypothetical protein
MSAAGGGVRHTAAEDVRCRADVGLTGTGRNGVGIMMLFHMMY